MPQHSPPAGRPTTARESNQPRTLAIDRTSPEGPLRSGLSQRSGAKEGLEFGLSGRLTTAVTDRTSGCRLHECTPHRAIIGGLAFPATHSWRTARVRIGQSKKDDGPNSDPSNSKQHSPHHQETPRPPSQASPSLVQDRQNRAGVHECYSVRIHDPCVELPAMTVHVSAPPLRCCSTQRRV